ncbi:MAG: 4Fe-4S binding protein [Candidatus Marinimicrobia bacterium]|nr:4Fe-4S binding protein [Candidatus Neomarinimicrobiota bacterium]
MKRKIIRINEEKCNGCGLCIPDCPEGALQMIDDKARLVSDLFCDGLGACIGNCPQDAIEVEEREALPYDERRVMEENIIKAGTNTIKAHLKHLFDHGEFGYYNTAIEVLKKHNLPIPQLEEKPQSCATGQCPGSKPMSFKEIYSPQPKPQPDPLPSELQTWPTQLQLMHPMAGYLKKADLLIAADCTPFAYANFHQDFIKGKVLVNFCPKLDQTIDHYIEKLTLMFQNNDIKSITIVRMEVPCCGGIEMIVRQALEKANSNLQLEVKVISIKGEVKN